MAGSGGGLCVLRTGDIFGKMKLGAEVVGFCVIGAAMTLPVAVLAEATTQALLVVVAVVNASLIALKRRAPVTPIDVPVWVPWLGLLACLAAFGGSVWAVLA